MNASAGVLLCLVVIGCSAVAQCAEPAEAIDEQTEALKALFLKYYTPIEYTVEPNAPQVKLPLDPAGVKNLEQLKAHLASNAARVALVKNAFVVVPGPGTDLFSNAYKHLQHRQIPIVVTSDSVLHLYHVLFDNALKQIEEEHFYDDLKAICQAMIGDSAGAFVAAPTRPLHPREKDAHRANVAYFVVAMKLLDPAWEPKSETISRLNVDEMVAKELALIEAHAGFAMSPLFGYNEDYSQYVPRGHYTQSEKLTRYFRAMMWFGRMTFLLKGNDEAKGINDALVTEAMANRQTLQALFVARDLMRNEALYAKWQRIYEVTAFFVGFSDDLSVDDYTTQDRIAGAIWSDEYLDAVRLRLAGKRSPLIYGGTGLKPVEEYTDEEVLGTLEATTGMRFMGQRFVPDSYVMGRLVNLPYTGEGTRRSPRASSKQGEALPFTYTMSALGPIRGFPRGLDVMHILGSARALDILDAEGDTDYSDYARHVGELRELFGGFDTGDWHQNLYWSWLASLRTLLAPFGAGYPSFMQTEAYTDKALNAAVASWSQLRHDTILYVKQSYAMVGSAAPEPPPAEPPGFVEPVPALYAELVALNAMTHSGLKELGVLSEEMDWRFRRTDRLLRRILALSIKELSGEPLDQNELRYIKDFGETLDNAIGELTADSKRTTIVADVHTDPNSGLVVEEGTGPVDLMWVVWKMPGGAGSPGGATIAGAGPVLSHYEFKHPMSDRLTDEKWREMVKGEAPARAPWTERFVVAGE